MPTVRAAHRHGDNGYHTQALPALSSAASTPAVSSSVTSPVQPGSAHNYTSIAGAVISSVHTSSVIKRYLTGTTGQRSLLHSSTAGAVISSVHTSSVIKRFLTGTTGQRSHTRTDIAVVNSGQTICVINNAYTHRHRCLQ